MTVSTTAPIVPTKPHKKKKQPRLFRYMVVSAWGCQAEKMKPGDVFVDIYHGRRHDWTIARISTGEFIGGYDGVLLEEYFPEETPEVAA